MSPLPVGGDAQPDGLQQAPAAGYRFLRPPPAPPRRGRQHPAGLPAAGYRFLRPPPGLPTEVEYPGLFVQRSARRAPCKTGRLLALGMAVAVLTHLSRCAQRTLDAEPSHSCGRLATGVASGTALLYSEDCIRFVISRQAGKSQSGFFPRGATMTPADFGLRLKAMREAANLTQKELGLKAGVSQNSISYYEKGERQPDFFVVVRLAKALGVTVQDFIPSEPPQDAPEPGGVLVAVC